MSIFEQPFPQERIGERLHVRRLAIVGRSTVTAFNVFVIGHIMALLLHLRHHLSRVPRMDSIIARRGQEN